MSARKNDLGQLVAELGPTFRRHPKRSAALAILFLGATAFVSGVLVSWLNSLFGATGVIMAIFFVLMGLFTLLSMAIEAYDAEMLARREEREREWLRDARRRIRYDER